VFCDVVGDRGDRDPDRTANPHDLETIGAHQPSNRGIGDRQSLRSRLDRQQCLFFRLRQFLASCQSVIITVIPSIPSRK
jgi:hypothetical protein